MDRSKFVGNDGLSNFSDMHLNVSQTAARELKERFVSRIVSYGVIDGLEVSDTSGGGATSVEVASGYGYGASGEKCYLGTATEITGIVTGDIGKYVVMSWSGVSGTFETHPVNGTSNATRIADGVTLSLATGVGTGMRLARITAVSGGSSVTFSEASHVDRDVFSSSHVAFGWITIGQPGDPNADFTGTDETPFNSAISWLVDYFGGGTLYVKAGTYTLSPSVIVSGATHIRVVGDGRASKLRSNSASGILNFQDCGSVVVEHLALYNSAASTLVVNDVDRLVVEGNYVSAYAAGSDNRFVNFGIDGVRHALFKRNYIEQDLMEMFLPTLSSGGVLENIVAENNYCSAAALVWSPEVGNLKAVANDFRSCQVFPHKAYPYTDPVGRCSDFQFAYNHFHAQGSASRWIRNNASGALIHGNRFRGLVDTNLLTGTPGSISSFATKFLHNIIDVTTTFDVCLQLSGGVSGCLLAGNVFLGNGLSSQKGVLIGDGINPTNHNVLDGNIFARLATPIDIESTSHYNWASGSNRVSNKIF